jgi:hypothetical protein
MTDWVIRRELLLVLLMMMMMVFSAWRRGGDDGVIDCVSRHEQVGQQSTTDEPEK